MEILDSGVEIKPGEENKIKGGACACACWQPYYNNSSISYPGHVYDICVCDCNTPPYEPDDQRDDVDSTMRYTF